MKLDYAFHHSRFEYPNLQHEIKRDDLIKNINYHFELGKKYVILTGENGIGKTIAIKQAIYSLGNNVIALFINQAHSGSITELDILDDLYNQLSWLVDLKPAPEDSISANEIISKIKTKISRNFDNNNKLYIAIDGLEKVKNNDVVKSILANMPFYMKGLQFLIGTSCEKTYESMASDITAKTVIPVPLLTKQEILELIPEISEEQVKYLISSIRPIPSQIEIIKRILDSGESIDNILNDFGDHNKNLFDTEWNLNLDAISRLQPLIDCITYSETPLSTEEALSITRENATIDDILKVSFVQIEKDKVNFSSEAMKQFCVSKRLEFRSNATDILTKIFESRRDSGQNIIDKIKLYSNSNKHESITSLLQPESLKLIYSETNSTNILSKAIRHGFESSAQQDNVKDSIKFSHLNTLVRDISASSSLNSEIETHLACGDLELARALANKTSIIEDKIISLSTIANYLNSHGEYKDENIIREIKFLYEKIKPEDLNMEKVMDISISLSKILPELSFSLISKVDIKGQSGENKNDFAYARLYLEALAKNRNGIDELDLDKFDISEMLRESLKSIKDIKSYERIDELVKRISSMKITPGDKITVLKDIIKKLSKNPDIKIAVMYCIDLIIDTTDYSPTASVLRDMSYCLLHHSGNEYNIICNKLKSQIMTAEKSGPRRDYFILLANIATYEYKTMGNSTRYVDIYKDIKSSDASLVHKLYCTLTIHSLWEKHNYTQYRGDVVSYKNSLFESIIKISAQQYSVLRDCLRIEARINLKNSYDWCSKLNTLHRRDKALTCIVKSYVSSDDFSVSVACDYISKIDSSVNIAEAIYELINNFEKLSSPKSSDYERLRKLRNKIDNYADKIVFSSMLIRIGESKNFLTTERSKILFDEIIANWEKIEGDWNKITFGFDATRIISESNKELADVLRRKIVSYRETCQISSNDVKNGIYRSIDLAVRTNYQLLKNGINSESNKIVLSSLIESIGDSAEKSRLLARFISSYQISGNDSVAKNIIEQKIFGELNLRKDSLDREYSIVASNCLPIVLSYDKDTYIKYISKINSESIFDDTVHSTISYLFDKRLLGDPYYYNSKNSYKLSYLDVKNIVWLIGMYKKDFLAYYDLKKLVNALDVSFKGSSFSTAQKSEITSMLSGLIDRFPYENCIKHDGYKILATALTYKISGEKSIEKWQSLYKLSLSISNVSDSIYTGINILDLSNPRLVEFRKSNLKDIVSK
ncbi:hypothetical protein [Rheinheimera hassiensis]|uniref:hypothetical protein n=1 Tax=Rheinheimera hassiensis TaxID=1193627 RepID=UPI001F06DD93|nr:hypothetical protein [Rheinheimera hassiensis]